ncbi:hypothetical protein HNR46_001253 [Haloferula luteola]|uniref:Peptidase M10 metallopeptidase domain-containing protein n=1 Tax=Haloferula luteola TaxID=595692 RepID=A0A840VB38_9BACT|nr:matrixin family metalloprotease [Haloferula luteola]MBB5351019.1 hypothetical protein [Haloferula luteola]
MRVIAFAAVLLPISVSAITVELDYRYDTNGFFDQPGAREAMRAVADHFEALLHDSLSAIQSTGSNNWIPRFFHPATGDYYTASELQNMVVPADTLIVFPGGRSLAGGTVGQGGPGGFSASGNQTWFDLVRFRGQTGATLASSTSTDFGPWGGSITFDTDETWNFDIQGRPANSQIDFVSIALHEMSHLLGFGTAASFDHYISGTTFTGPASSAVWGGAAPLDSGLGHWRNDGACAYPLGYVPSNPDNVLSLTCQSFGRPHAEDQIAIMDPGSCTIPSITYLQVLTDLDLAGLRDVGWEVSPPPRLNAPQLAPLASSLSWPTTSGISYRLRRSIDLISWTTLTGPTPGNGDIATYQDSNAPTDRAFYQLETSLPTTAPSFTSPPPPEVTEGILIVHPRIVDACGTCPCCDSED